MGAFETPEMDDTIMFKNGGGVQEMSTNRVRGVLPVASAAGAAV
jgi:hypothetical protein